MPVSCTTASELDHLGGIGEPGELHRLAELVSGPEGILVEHIVRRARVREHGHGFMVCAGLARGRHAASCVPDRRPWTALRRSDFNPWEVAFEGPDFRLRRLTLVGASL